MVWGNLEPPAELRVWPVSDSEIRLEWKDYSTEELGFRIQRAVGEDGIWEELAVSLSPDTQSYLDTALAPGTLYAYRVGAVGTGHVRYSGTAKTQTDERAFGTRTLSFQNGYGNYSGTLSVGIVQGQPSTSLSQAIVWVDNNSASDQSQVLLVFRGIFGEAPDQVPLNASIESATLRLYLGTTTNVQSGKPIDFHRMLKPWDETTSWASTALGGNGVRKDGVEAVVKPDAIQVFNEPERYYSMDVTTSLKSWAAGENEHGWAVLTNWSDGFGLHTERQAIHAQRPELLVSFDADPGNAAPVFGGAPRPVDGAVSLPDPARIRAEVSDPDGHPLSVSLFGRRAALADPDFRVILLPDTQFYSAEINGGTRHMFFRQTDWIVESHEALNIAFVLHMGDISQSGDIKNGQPNSLEWSIAAQAMYRLHNPFSTGLAEGLPFVVSVGNHDQEPIWRSSGTSDFFNQYFGERHFSAYSYYGGHYGENNDNYYCLLEKGAHRFIVISMEYWDPARDPVDPALLQWADDLLKQYPDRIGIVVSHHMVNPGNPATWSPYGELLYEVLKDNPNLRLMLGGHVTGEGFRTDTFEGNTVYAVLQDYQGMELGGGGFLRILKFSPQRNELSFRTYSPWLDRETDEFGGPFTVPFAMGTVIEPFVQLSLKEGISVPAGVSFEWPDLLANTAYEWYLVADDGRKHSRMGVHTFVSASSTYASWRKGYFDDGDVRGGALEDPDLDGNSNQGEYLFGGNPLVADSLEFRPFLQSNRLRLTYHRRVGTGWEWNCEYSDDLSTWMPLPVSEAGEEVVESLAAMLEAVELELARDPQGPARFWRIRPVPPDL